jgi:hypothetical protein
MLARQVLYHLSHILSLSHFFCFSYFSGRSLLFCLDLASDHDSPIYTSLIADDRHVPPYLSHLLRWDLANFLPKLALIHSLPNLCLTNSWDYMSDPLNLT